MFYSLIIIGAGGLGRSMFSVALADPSCGKSWYPMGYLDTRKPEHLPSDVSSLIIGDPTSYIPRPHEIFITCVGDPELKESLLQNLIVRQANFIQFAPGVEIGANSKVGNVTFGRRVVVGVNCEISDHCFVDQNALIGHNVRVGEYCYIGPNTFMADNVQIGRKVEVHAGCMIGEGVKIGDGTTLSIGTVVLQDVPAQSLVMGNPARAVRKVKP